MDVWAIVLAVAILILEYFLGSTKIIKPNSLIETIVESVKGVLIYLRDTREVEEKKEE